MNKCNDHKNIKNDLLHEDFETSSRLYPDNIAITYYEVDNFHSKVHITYKQLSDAANNIDTVLRVNSFWKLHSIDSGQTPSVIGICCKCPPVVVACMLAIMRHGAFFYFSDELTISEWTTILEKVQPVALLVGESSISKIESFMSMEINYKFCISSEVMFLISISLDSICQVQESNVEPNNDNDVAYVMTTSGSTGVPKVVYVAHKCIVPNVKDFVSLFNLTEYDVILGVSPLTFDPSIIDIFSSLSSGAKLIMLSPNAVNKPEFLDYLVNDNHITILQATPSFISMLKPNLLKNRLLSNDKNHLKILAFGGEEFPSPTTLRRWASTDCKTKIFNLYGVTEISCWASSHEVDLQEYLGKDLEKNSSNRTEMSSITEESFSNLKTKFLSKTLTRCPLGKPLTGTVIKVLNDEGKPIADKEVGNIVLSGDRASYQNKNVNNLKYLDYLATGDIGYLENNEIYYIDRKDHIVKRNGHKISLAEIETHCKRIDNVENCCAVAWDHNIFLYILQRTDSHNSLATIKKGLKAFLSVWKLPDDILIIDKFPMNRNGKIDRKSLTIKSKADCLLRLKCYSQIITLNDVLKLAEHYLETTTPLGGNNFIALGGHSLSAISLCNKIEKILKRHIPLLLPTVFEGTLCDVYDVIIKGENKLDSPIINEDNLAYKNSSNKRFKAIKEDTINNSVEDSINNSVDDKISNSAELFNSKSSIKLVSRRGFSVNGRHFIQYFGDFCDEMSIEWKIDLGKCIDSSPLIVDTSELKVCLIGCHSHKFYSVDIDKGFIVWTTLLPDRIESSAAVSVKDKKVFVGCYDGNLFCLNLLNGSIIWKFKTEGTIKSTPFIDPETNLLFFGSHDKNLYCIDDGGSLHWKCKISNASIFSSPVVHADKVYSGTLDGFVACNDISDGKLVWKVLVGKPIFSSLVSFHKGILFGCVDYNVYCYSFEGELLWKFATEAPVFSSAFIIEKIKLEYNDTRTATIFSIGSHDYCVYILNDSGILLKKLKFDSPIYSTPYLALSQGNTKFGEQEIEIKGAVCQTNGEVVCFSCKLHSPISDESSNIVTIRSLSLVGEVFSSPVLYDHKLFVGCRDNNLYCINTFKI